MKTDRLYRIGVPLLLLLLVCLCSDISITPQPGPATSAAPLPSPAFPDWLTAYASDPQDISLSAGIAAAKQRRIEMKHLIENDPGRALELAIPAALRATLPAEIVDQLETPISAAGAFELVATCYTGNLRKPAGAKELERFVTIGNDRYRAFTFGRRTEMQTKDRISIHGIIIDDAIAIDPYPAKNRTPLSVEAFGKIETFADEDDLNYYTSALLAYEDAPGPGFSLDGDGLPVAESAWTEGEKRILYLRVRFADQDPAYEPVTLATAQSHQANVEAHMAASSFGKMTITTTFPDTITLSQNKSAYVGQGLGTMMNEARDAAITMGQAQGQDWDYNNHDFYTIISDGGIGSYAGVAQVGGKKSHLQKGYTSLRTAGHEFGHNFGLSHAFYNYTKDLSPTGSTPVNGLNRVEYGHRFSLMSAQSGSDLDHPLIPHFTVHEKSRLDWITSADYTDITSGSQSGTYRIYQNDDENATGNMALRVPSSGALPKYWLSYRTAWRTPNRSSDNDYLLNGIVIDWTSSSGGTSTLLDTTPYSDDGSHSGAYWTTDNDDKWDAPLLIGRTYTDEGSNTSITPVARGGTAPNEYIDTFVYINAGAEITLQAETDACRAIVPTSTTASGTSWTAIGYNDSAWPLAGALGVGYDEESTYLPFFSVDTAASMNNIHPGCYIRIPFNVSSTNIASLKLHMRYDDGFVAYINGVEVARANAPASPAWDSGATTSHSDSASVNFVEFSANAALGSLIQGTNVLSIHGLNSGTGSSDFLIQPKLTANLTSAPVEPPIVSLSASSLAVGVNQDVTLTASASDPNGDTLAYAWDFDIGDIFAPEGLNSATAVRRWSSAGLYAVTVTVSDRKGGIAKDRVMIKVGNPANDGIISGRVLRGGLPVGGARVFVAGTDTQSITLDDGTYLIAGLSTSSAFTIGAMLDNEIFNASVPLPASAPASIDFYAHSSNIPEAPAQALTVSPQTATIDTSGQVQLAAKLWDNTAGEDLLIPFGDTWTYLDTGIAPDSSWPTAAFDDSAWLSGPAQLGYGDSETTVVSYGSDPANRHITTWFRRTFNVSNTASVSRLKLSVRRDDGIRVFLNGTEIARDNLTTGTVSATTKASYEVTGTPEDTLIHFTVDPALLVDGPNTVAAEVHLENIDSTDLTFDLALSAARNLTPVTPAWSVTPAGAAVSPAGLFTALNPGLYTVTATSGTASDTATIEVTSDNVISVAALDKFLWENGATSSTIRLTRTGNTGATLTVPLSVSGDAISADDFSPLPNSATFLAGQSETDVILTPLDDTKSEGREIVNVILQPGGLYTLGAVSIASVTIIDDENTQVPVPDAGSGDSVYAGDALALSGTTTGLTTIISGGDYWKYDDSGINFGTTWQAPSFSDLTWLEGLGKFGYGDNNEITTTGFGSSSSAKQITTYFRRSFFLPDAADYSSLTASLLVDDGAVIYINGTEVLRRNMPAGAISYTTTANATVGGNDETTYFPSQLAPANLITGENVISAEGHQSSQTSSDFGFDLTLSAGTFAAPQGSAIHWEQTSGPGTATFADFENPLSSVSFDLPGTYTLSLIAEYEGSAYSDDVTVTVLPVPEFAQWITGYPLSDPAPLADPDQDDWNNLMEYASATNPASGSSNALPDLTRDQANPGHLLFTYRRLKALGPGHATGTTGNGYSLYGISYTVEATTDINNWQPAAGILTLQQQGTPVDNNDGSETITLRLIPPVNNTSRWFARLSVTAD